MWTPSKFKNCTQGHLRVIHVVVVVVLDYGYLVLNFGLTQFNTTIVFNFNF